MTVDVLLSRAKAQIGKKTVYGPGNATSGMPGPKIGHIGVITTVAANGSYRVMHCSSGNFRSTADAIPETQPTMFTPASTILAWASPVA